METKCFFLTSHEAAIEPLLAKLTFIQNQQRWGFPFRRGCFEISKTDFTEIAQAMGIYFNEQACRI